MKSENNSSVNERKKKRKRRIITVIIIVIIIIILLLLRRCGEQGGTQGKDDEDSVTGNFVISDEEPQTDNESSENPFADTTITFAGYDNFEISEDSPNIILKNPEINTVDMVFEVTDKETGEVVALTDKVPPGKFVYVDVTNFYTESGVYYVLVNTSTFDCATGTPLNGMNHEMEIIVK